MKHVLEVAHLVNGDLVSVRQLSARRERWGILSAVLFVSLASLLVVAIGAMLVRLSGRSIFAPRLLALWAAVALAASVGAASMVRRRLRRYVLGARLDADAFAPMDVELVGRARDHFDLRLVPGMTGYVDTAGRVPLPVEALVSDGARTMTLTDGATAQLSLGTSTFVVRSRPITGSLGGIPLSRDFFRLFSRVALCGMQVALLGTLFCTIPGEQIIGDRAAHLVAPHITTPWEAEKWLRIEAQAQARSLHQCFDPLPLTCQHSGYVGVGVSLTREGEVRSNWIARSTYGGDCLVDQCVKEVVSTWVFDPLPEAMRVVLPVQVLRTQKPLPTTTNIAQADPIEEPKEPMANAIAERLGAR